MGKKLNTQEFEKLVKSMMLQEIKSLSENMHGDEIDLSRIEDPRANQIAQADFTTKTSAEERELARKLSAQLGLGVEPEIKSQEKLFGAGSINEEPIKMEKPLGANGKPMGFRTRVVDTETGSSGHVLRFGIDDNGKQTVHVEWIQNFGGPIPKTITYPEKVNVEDAGRIVRKEEEIEEGMGQSYAIGRGENLKPSNYPETLQREGIQENLDHAVAGNSDEVFLVIDNAFNRSHYPDMVGQTFVDAPAYAQVKVVRLADVEKEKKIKYDEPTEAGVPLAETDFDYSAEERGYHDKEEHKNIESFVGKKIKINNMDDITNLLFQNNRRIISILNDVKSEIAAERVINNRIAATDNMDTVWIFDVVGSDDENVYLEFTGTAK